MSACAPWLLMLFAAWATSACAPPREPVLAEGPVAAPASGDVAGGTCLDVGEGRACWGERCREGCVVPPDRVSAPRPYGGFRCSGSGDARTCVARSQNAGRFRCDGDTCRQPHPRSPDAGEWECVDLHGAYVCRSVSEAAGIPRGRRDPAFVCGTRRGTGEPICVDFAPDLPEGPGPYACSMRYVSGVAERVCARKPGALLGTRCRAGADCPEGARCVSSRCLPAEPHPDCWFDKDCAADARCRFGSCT